MFDIKDISSQISTLKKDLNKNYDKLLNIYLRLIIEYYHTQKTDEDL
jgi:hypothetical protein